MLRNTENMNSVALILSDINIGLVVATGSAIAHDLRLRERLHEMPMEEFPGRPMLGKRPADPQPDTNTYPGGGVSDCPDTSCVSTSSSVSPSEPAESQECSQRILKRFSQTQKPRHKHWLGSRVAELSRRSGNAVFAPVYAMASVSS